MLETAPAINKPDNTKPDNVVFVLWGEYFEEAAAAIIVTKLRQAGICVKLVGLAGQRPIGKNGLALYPDITLGEALRMAERAVCVVLPCSATTLRHVEADPRIIDFFQKSQMAGTRFIISAPESIRNTHLEKMLGNREAISTYGPLNNLLVFADDLAQGLSNAYGV